MISVLFSLHKEDTNKDILMKPIIPVAKNHGSCTWVKISILNLPWMGQL